jgi:hypothetical protein
MHTFTTVINYNCYKKLETKLVLNPGRIDQTSNIVYQLMINIILRVLG